MGFRKRQSGLDDLQKVIQDSLRNRDYKAALGAFKTLLKKNPNSTQMRMRFADTLVLAGRKDDAIDEYRQVAETMAESGYLVKAIATYKKVIKLDPRQTDILETITRLDAERQGNVAPAPKAVPAPAPAASAGGGQAYSFEFEESTGDEIAIGSFGMEADDGPEIELGAGADAEPEPEVSLDALDDLGAAEMAAEADTSAAVAAEPEVSVDDLAAAAELAADDLGADLAPAEPEVSVDDLAAAADLGAADLAAADLGAADLGADDLVADAVDLAPAELATDLAADDFGADAVDLASAELATDDLVADATPGVPSFDLSPETPADEATVAMGDDDAAVAAAPEGAGLGFSFDSPAEEPAAPAPIAEEAVAEEAVAEEAPAAAGGLDFSFGNETVVQPPEELPSGALDFSLGAPAAEPEAPLAPTIESQPDPLASSTNAPLSELFASSDSLEVNPEEGEDLLALIGDDIDAMIDDIISDVGGDLDDQPMELGQADTNIALFSHLAMNEFVEVLKLLDRTTVREGDVIVNEGDEGNSMYIISGGEVDATILKDGTALRVATLGEGEFFGEMAVLQSTPRSATVTALKNTELLVLEREKLQQIFSSYPEIEAKIRLASDERGEKLKSFDG